jgi:hypothetical protein
VQQQGAADWQSVDRNLAELRSRAVPSCDNRDARARILTAFAPDFPHELRLSLNMKAALS